MHIQPTPPSPCNINIPAALLQVQATNLECQDDTQAAHMSANSNQDRNGVAPPPFFNDGILVRYYHTCHFHCRGHYTTITWLWGK